MAGKIYRASIRDTRKLPEDCVMFACTVKRVNASGIVDYPALAPSTELFHYYLDNRKSNPNWWSVYKERFLQEIKQPQMQTALSRITGYLDKGFSIALTCFCTDPNTCHTTLLVEEIVKRGYELGGIF